MERMAAPILGKPIMPTLTKEQVHHLLDSAECVRDKAIIATLTESGLRLSELANIKASDIDWQAKTGPSARGAKRRTLPLAASQRHIYGNGFPGINPTETSGD